MTIGAPVLKIEKLATRFAEPLRISGYVFDAMPSVLVVLTAGSCAGRGEAAGVYYLGDDQQHMIDTIESVRTEIENGLQRSELQQLLPAGGARNALDCALWEVESHLASRPVWELAGITSPKPLLTTFTLPADDPSVLATKVERLSTAKAIKLKLEGDLELDRERIAVIRKARPDVWLGVDANQGFEERDLEELVRVAADFSISLIEQPIKRGNEEALEGWNAGVPVAADESILDLEELRERARFFDVINIKLDKCGGLTEALAMAKAARSLGKQVMVGNMGGSILATAPAFVVGQLCDVVDLDGPYALAGNSSEGGIYSDGHVFVPEAVWGAS